MNIKIEEKTQEADAETKWEDVKMIGEKKRSSDQNHNMQVGKIEWFVEKNDDGSIWGLKDCLMCCRQRNNVCKDERKISKDCKRWYCAWKESLLQKKAI